MYEIDVDDAENRIYITLDGSITESEAADATDQVLAAADRLDSFAIVNDISGFNPASQEAAEEIARAKEGIAQRGVDTIVRVLPDSAIAKMQFDRVGDVDYDVVEVETVEEADEYLDG